jgi:spermidine synthase
MTTPSTRRSFGLQEALIIGLFSMTLLLYELCLTRVLSVFFFHHTAFLAVSLTMLGLGAGGVWVYLFPRRFPGLVESWIVYSGVGAALLPLLLTWLKLDWNVQNQLGNSRMMLTFLLVAAVCWLPFLGAGILLSRWFQEFQENATRVYAWDLVGAAVGALLLVPVMEAMGGPAALVFTGLLFTLVATFAAFRGERRRLMWMAGGLSLFLLVIFGSQLRFDWMTLQIDQTTKNGRPLFKKWNAFSRVVLLNHQDWDRGISKERQKHWKGKIPHQLDALIDINAFAPLLKFDGDLRKVRFLRQVVSNLGYHLRKPGKKVVVLGPGGGKDILAALQFKPSKVVGIELNPILVNDLVKGRFKKFTGDLYRRKDVTIHLGDGRAVLERLKERFDFVVANSVVTLAAHSSGAMNLAENSLYTAEACKLYLSKLTKRGILSVSLWDTATHALPMRWFSTCGKAAKSLGIASLKDRVAIVANKFDSRSNFVNLLISRSPWTPEQKATLTKLSKQWDYPLHYISGHKGNIKVYNRYFKDPLAFQKSFGYDISPATDNRPFFLYTLPWYKALQFWKHEVWSENAAVVNLLFSLVLVSFLLLLLIFGPLLWHRVRRSTTTALRGSEMLYFAAIGLGFMLIEIPFIQRLTLYLGHPTYALTVVLAGLLLWCGIGNLLGNQLSRSIPPRTLLLGTLGFLVLIALSAQPLLQWGLSWSHSWGIQARIMVVLVGLLPLGLAMGVSLPLGLQWMGDSRKDAVPWAWGINGASSVVASVAALWFAAQFGFTLVFWLSAGFYGLAWLALWRGADLSKTPEAEVQG